MPQQSNSKYQPFARGPWHDRFFKSHFETPEQIKSLLILALTAAELKLFDLSSITVRKSSLPDAAELQEHLSDLIVEVRLKSGDQVVIGILIEHKSGQDRELMRQLLVYMARLYDRNTPAVLPVTIYHGRSKWRREKSFHAFEHAGLPHSFLTAFKEYLIDFKTIFINLRDERVRQRLAKLPLKERLALQVMAGIWEADADRFASWLVQCRSLPQKERAATIGSLHNYFAQTHESITIPQVNQALQTKRSGARTMQDRQLIDEIIKEWNGVLPESYGEAYSQGIEKGRIEGIEEGRKEGKKEGRIEGIEEGKKEVIRQTTYEFAQRMIEDGMPAPDIQRYTQLSLEEIEKLRNGSGSG